MRLIVSMSSLRRSTRIFGRSQSSSATFVAVTEPNSDPVGPALTSKRSSRRLEPLRDPLRLVGRLRLVPRALRVALAASSRTAPASRARRGRAAAGSCAHSRARRSRPRRAGRRSRRPAKHDFASASAPRDRRGRRGRGGRRPRVVAALGHVRQQRHLARPLHRDRDLALVAAARAADPARADLPLLGDVAPELADVLVVDLVDLRPCRRSRTCAGPPSAAAGASCCRPAVALFPAVRPSSPSERNVVVARRAERSRRRPGGRAGRDELVVAAAPRRRPPSRRRGTGRCRRSTSTACRFGAVLRLPLAPLEPAVDATGRPFARYCAQFSPWLPQTVMSK